MADNSFAWAKERGLVRRNTVHGEEEAKLVLLDAFSRSHQSGNEMSAKGAFEVEDPNGTLLEPVSYDLTVDSLGGEAHEAPQQSTEALAVDSGSFKFLSFIFPIFLANDFYPSQLLFPAIPNSCGSCFSQVDISNSVGDDCIVQCVASVYHHVRKEGGSGRTSQGHHPIKHVGLGQCCRHI